MRPNDAMNILDLIEALEDKSESELTETDRDVKHLECARDDAKARRLETLKSLHRKHFKKPANKPSSF